MIKINGEIINIGNYPDGTLLVKYNKQNKNDIKITWHYESDSELFALISLTKHLKKNNNKVSLNMPYVPHGRMDRVKTSEDVFTLKYFAEVINWLDFNSVTVLDPHSSVSGALINNIVINHSYEYVRKVIREAERDDDSILMFYPDEGAMKRYSGMFNKPYAFGIKKRDWNTGKILGLEIQDNGINLKDKTILMIDDIISYGGSLYYSAKALKEIGVGKIYAYATHTENSILDKEKGALIKALENNTVEKLFTTNSLFTGKHEKIEVMEV